MFGCRISVGHGSPEIVLVEQKAVCTVIFRFDGVEKGFPVVKEGQPPTARTNALIVSRWAHVVVATSCIDGIHGGTPCIQTYVF